jgi:hypothetical protein
MPAGFAPPRTAERVKRYWLSIYSQEDEDTPLEVIRFEVSHRPGQDPLPKALRHAELMIRRDPRAFDVIIHHGPDPEPSSGELVLARVCREPFRDSAPLPEAPLK